MATTAQAKQQGERSAAGGAARATTSVRLGRRSLVDTVTQDAVSALFMAIVPALCRVRIHREAPVVLDRRTLVVIAHKSDLDIPVLVRALFGPSIWPRWTGRLTFIGRSDLFLRGFIALRFPQLGPLRRWLYPLDLAPALRAARIIPVGKPGPRLVAQWIAELTAVYGPEQTLRDLLSRPGLERARAAGVPPSLTLGHAAAWDYRKFLSQDAGPELIDEQAQRRLRLDEARGAHAQFAEIVDALDGGPLVMAPEGDLTPDGQVQSFRSGLYRVLRSVPEARVLPVGITYDLLCEGRPFTFVRVGRPQAGLAALGRRDCEARVRDSFAALATVTLAQLVGGIVFEELGPQTATVPKAVLAQRAAALAEALASSGRPVDPRLLERGAFQQRFNELLRKARGSGLAEQGGTVRIDWEVLCRPVKGPLENPLAYAYNELRSGAAAAGGTHRAEERV